MADSDTVGLIAGAVAMGVVGIVWLVRNSMSKSSRFQTYAQYWQDALRQIDPNVRVTATGSEFTAELAVDGLPFRVEFREQVSVIACVPPGLAVALPPGGRIGGIAQRIEWAQGSPLVRVGLERSTSLATICHAMAPVVREAIGKATAGVDGRPLA